MIGELLYHLHRRFRLVLIAGGLVLALGAVAFGCSLARHTAEPSARPAEAERA